MGKSKKYFYDYKTESMGTEKLCEIILNDDELNNYDEIIIGIWGECCQGDDCQKLIDMFVDNSSKFSHIKSLFVGDMESEECEVSWIEQGDYSKLFNALPNLEHLTIKGSNGLVLGDIVHNNLLSLEIICGGIPVSVINSIAKAKLPKLNKLILYIGIEDYGFDGTIDDIKSFLDTADFPSLKYLGLRDSEIQDEITEAVLNSKFIKQIDILDLSEGTISDKGGQLLLDNAPNLSNIKHIDLHYNYLSDDMIKKLSQKFKDINLDEQNEIDEDEVDEDYDGRYPMLTE